MTNGMIIMTMKNGINDDQWWWNDNEGQWQWNEEANDDEMTSIMINDQYVTNQPAITNNQ